MTALIVPMELDALVVNDQVRWGVPFQRWRAGFHHLRANVSPEPEAFTNNSASDWDATPGANGVYLQWQLPQALRHGRHDAATGETTFPRIPNRWMVVRSVGTGRRVAWLVESDYLGKDATTPYAAPSAPDGIRIGRRIALEDWTEQNPQGGPAVDVTGPGLLTFSTYQPYNENVLSVHDDLAQVGEEETLSYQVIGWYSDPARDHLTTAGGMAAQGWRVPGSPAVPDRSFYVGYALGLGWKRNGGAPVSGRPTGTSVGVAVGSSSVDALTGLLLDGGLDASQAALLEALQHGLLDELDDTAHEAVDHAIHRSWFSTIHGGFGWEAVDRPSAPLADEDSRKGRTEHTRDVPIVQLDAAQRDAEKVLLGKLNADQRTYDELERELAELRWRLYGVWWLNRSVERPAELAGPFATALAGGDGTLAAQITEKNADLVARRSPAHGEWVPWAAKPADLPAEAEAYAQAKGLHSGRMLKRAPLAEFHAPNDPVVMLTGLAVPPAPDPSAVLDCRESVVSAIRNVAAPDPALLITRHDDAASTVPLNQLPDVGLCAGLVVEFGLLVAARLAGMDIPALPAGDVTGPLPWYGTGAWAQPWHPLYLMYEVRYYPVPYPGNWAFNGTRYTWQATGSPGAQGYRTFRGRIHLTPHARYNLAGRLREYQRVHPAAPKQIAELATAAGKLDVISQALDGFTRWISGHAVGVHPHPHGDTVAGLIAGQQHTVPLPGVPPRGSTWAESVHGEVRAGQFRFDRLAVVDRFGQACDVIDPLGTGGATDARAKRLVPARSCTPATQVVTGATEKTFAELAPRLLQAARLRFEPTDISGGDAGPGTDPVAGWVLPNHLDGALSVFGSRGHGLGEVRRIATGGLGWDPAPGSVYPTIASLAGDYPVLEKFLTPLAARSHEDFVTVLAAIDETLFTVNPLGGWDDQTLTVLAGRPLALVTARTWFELAGPPLLDPSWERWRHVVDPATGALPRRAFLDYTWQVRLGTLANQDDGLIGYFLNGDYPRLHAVHCPAGSPDYLAPIGAGYPLRLLAGAVPEPAALTLLVDPRVAVHAVTEILPATALTIPASAYERGLRNLRISLRMGPLLAGTTLITDPANPAARIPALAAPRPSTRHGDWQWRQPVSTTAWSDPLPVAPPRHPAATSLIARTGRLVRGGPIDD